MWLLKAAQVRSYEIRYSFDSGCLADSALQHQTHFNLSCIGPRLDRNRLAAGAAAGEHTSGVANDWHASNSLFYCRFWACSSFLALYKVSLQESWTQCPSGPLSQSTVAFPNLSRPSHSMAFLRIFSHLSKDEIESNARLTTQDT